MSEIKINLNGMSLLDVIKAYPEQVLQAIEQHNKEAKNSAMAPFLAVECFADNGEHSHWKLVERETGCTLWEQHQ